MWEWDFLADREIWEKSRCMRDTSKKLKKWGIQYRREVTETWGRT